MLRMKHFCIDIDNVVARTDEVMRQVIEEYTGGRVRLAYEHIKEFNYHECKDDRGNSITREDWRKVHELFSEPRYLWLIQPVSGAVEGLRQLADRSTVHFATSRLPKARRTTVEWLENHSFPPHDLHFLKHGEKHASLRPFTAAVEDDYEQGVAFATLGETPCFLLRHPWNQTKPVVDGVQWVDTWPELIECLLALIP
jgi:uncharacterized HAD superfamily protein